jgi:small subunit ribosomal protein S2
LKLIYPSLRCIQVIAGVLGRAGESGQAKRLLAAKTGEITWLPPPGLGKPYDEEAEKRKAEAAATKKKEEEEKKAQAASGELHHFSDAEFENSLQAALADPELSEEERETLRGLRTVDPNEEVDDSEAFEKARLELNMELEKMRERLQEDLRRLEEKKK